MGKILGTNMANEDGFRRAMENALIDGKKKHIRIFLSLPMSGRSDESIAAQIEQMKTYILESKIFGNSEIEFVDNVFSGKLLESAWDENEDSIPKHKRLAYLGLAIAQMADCDAIALGKDWQKAKGCKVEHEVARQYSIPIFRCYSLENLITLKENRERFVQEIKNSHK